MTATKPDSLIHHLVRIRGIARSFGAEFIFSTNGAAVRLPEKSAPHISDAVYSEFTEAGYIQRSPDAEGLGLVLMEKVDFQTFAFTFDK